MNLTMQLLNMVMVKKYKMTIQQILKKNQNVNEHYLYSKKVLLMRQELHLMMILEMMEQENGRTVVEISIRRTGGPDEYGIIPVFAPVPFQRIRRITGYLVGDLNRFNNAKRAEVSDRVKHTT